VHAHQQSAAPNRRSDRRPADVCTAQSDVLVVNRVHYINAVFVAYSLNFTGAVFADNDAYLRGIRDFACDR
jgi:hypothetical protein